MVLADIGQWPAWNPAVRDAWFDGPLEVGTHLRLAMGLGTRGGALTSVDAPRILAWRVRYLGVRSDQSWRLEERPGGSHIRAEQSLSGLVVRLLTSRFQERAQADLDTWTRLLKLEAETRTRDDEAESADEEPSQLAETPQPPTGDAS